MELISLIQFAGIMHLGILAAGALMPGIVGFNKHIKLLTPFLQSLFKVYYGFIGGTVVAFGSISFFLADNLAYGGPVANAILLTMTLFWLARFGVALFVFDLTPFLTNRWRRIGYQLTNIAFLYLPTVYGYAFLKGITQ
ncbi:hypothetical protein N9059_00740 [bacterium]|nr:hypothetical protein [bacterium]